MSLVGHHCRRLSNGDAAPRLRDSGAPHGPGEIFRGLPLGGAGRLFLSLKFLGAEAEAVDGERLFGRRRNPLGGSSGVGRTHPRLTRRDLPLACGAKHAVGGFGGSFMASTKPEGCVQRRPSPYGPGQSRHLLAVVALGMVVTVRQVIVPGLHDDLPGARGASDDIHHCHNPPPVLLRSVDAMGEFGHRSPPRDRGTLVHCVRASGRKKRAQLWARGQWAQPARQDEMSLQWRGKRTPVCVVSLG